jgi:hypothetical protein
VRTLTLTLATLLVSATSARADKIGPPESYKTASADGKFVFIMLTPDKDQKDATGLREAYAQSGLYKAGSKEPLWTVDWYARSVAVASDGAHVVRYGGPHAYAERLNPDRTKRVMTAADLKKEALTVLAKGKVVKELTIGDFVSDATKLPHTVTFFRWHKQAKLIDDKLQLELLTLEENRVLVDLATGKVIEPKKPE